MKTYLAAIDFSAISMKVVECAVQIATAAGARLEILHVVELPPLREPGSEVVRHFATINPPNLEQIREQLEEIAAPLRKNGLDVNTIVSVGVPLEEILKQAKSQEVSILILGSHGHGRVLQVFAGSLVTAVLQKAEVPVMVIPAHKK